jgi:hypothetical protein
MNAPQLVILIFIFSCAVGAGHNGLELTGHLKVLETSSLLIDKEARVGVYSEGIKNITAGCNSMDLHQGSQAAVNRIVELLSTHTKTITTTAEIT